MRSILLAAILAPGLLSSPVARSSPAKHSGLRETAISASGVSEGLFEAADGVKLFYRKIGQGKDPAVLIHGGPGFNMGVVWPDIDALARSETVLMYDQRGAGRSEIIKDPALLKISHHVRDLEALRLHFGLDRMIIIAQSWGAGIAASYCAAHPDRVKRLLLLGPMPPTKALMDIRLKKLNEEAGDSYAPLADLMKSLPTTDDPAAVCRQYLKIYFKPKFVDPTAQAKMRSDPCGAPPEGIRNWPLVSDAGLSSLGNWDFLRPLSNFNTPILIVEGAGSKPTLEGVYAWAAGLPQARLLLVPKAGHFPMVERPDFFFPAVEEFLNGHWPKAARREPAVGK
jgi:proline iminopeptidase